MKTCLLLLNKSSSEREIQSNIRSIRDKVSDVFVVQMFPYSSGVFDRSITVIQNKDTVLKKILDFDRVILSDIIEFPKDFTDILLENDEKEITCLHGFSFKTKKENVLRTETVDLYDRTPNTTRKLERCDSGKKSVDVIRSFPIVLSKEHLAKMQEKSFSEIFNPMEISVFARRNGIHITCVDAPLSWCRFPRSNYGTESFFCFTKKELESLTSINWISGESLKTETISVFESSEPVASVDCEEIVSLTMVPWRASSITRVLWSLLNQTFRPKKILLYASELNFPNRKISEELENFLKKEKRVKLIWERDDIRSFKKLLPIMRDFRTKNIITADDDLVYKPDFIEKLVRQHEKNPGKIIGNYYNLMCVNDGCLKHGRGMHFDHVESLYIKPGTGAGMYFPGGIFKGTDFHRKELFMTMMPTHDELWVWLQALVNRIPIVCSGDYPSWSNMGWSKEIVTKKCLSKENLNNIHFYMAAIDRYLKAIEVPLPYDPIIDTAMFKKEKFYL